MSLSKRGRAQDSEAPVLVARPAQNCETASISCHVIIVGAGLSGLAAAIGLLRSGHGVTVLEKTEELREVGAGIQIPANSSRILADLGVLEEVQRYSTEPHSLIIRSYQGPLLFNQELCPAIRKRFHFPHLLIHRADIRRILYNEAQRAGAIMRLGAEVQRVDLWNDTVHLTTGEHLQGDLILGADGEHSVCRDTLLGRPDPPCSSGDIVYRISLSAVEISKDPDLACLIDPPQVLAWYGPDSHAVCYQLRKDSIFNIVLTLPDRRSCEAPILGPQPADLETIRHDCATWDPKFQKLLLLAKKAMKWTLLETGEIESWIHPRGHFALLGDSAHATLPYLYAHFGHLTAQGAAMALESSYVISCLLSKMKSLSQLPSILRLYVSIRQPRARRTKQRSLHMHDTCQLPDGPAQRERDRILKEEKPGLGFPNPWADPEFQEWMWGFDAKAETERAWDDLCSRQGSKKRVAETQGGKEHAGMGGFLAVGTGKRLRQTEP